MGGPGSGNPYAGWGRRKKATVEDCLGLDASRWMREGILKAGVRLSGCWRSPSGIWSGVPVNYQVETLDPARPFVRLCHPGGWASAHKQVSADYWVRLTATRPRFGGLRWWFVCPLLARGRPCNRRVGKLYLTRQGRYFGCRHCHQLTYTSCRESHKDDGLFRRLAAGVGQDFATVKGLMQQLTKGLR
jgi:hypothetical protein